MWLRNKASVSSPTPTISELDAIKFAETALGGTYNDHPTKREYVITDTHSAILAYVIQIQSNEHWYEVFVSANSPSPSIVNLIDFTAHAAYRALPFTVQYPTPSAFQLIQNPQDLSASPNGWHADTSSYTTTRGNNVIAMHGGVATPQTSSPLVFDYTWDPSSSPTSAVNANAATVNAFYIGNTVHVRRRRIPKFLLTQSTVLLVGYHVQVRLHRTGLQLPEHQLRQRRSR